LTWLYFKGQGYNYQTTHTYIKRYRESNKVSFKVIGYKTPEIWPMKKVTLTQKLFSTTLLRMYLQQLNHSKYLISDFTNIGDYKLIIGPGVKIKSPKNIKSQIMRSTSRLPFLDSKILPKVDVISDEPYVHQDPSQVPGS
jgi:hypothetical protein